MEYLTRTFPRWLRPRVLRRVTSAAAGSLFRYWGGSLRQRGDFSAEVVARRTAGRGVTGPECRRRPPIILVPGAWLTGASWQDVQGLVNSRGSRVVALSLPGRERNRGMRSVHDYSENDYVEFLAAEIARVGEEEGIAPVVVAHSMTVRHLERVIVGSAESSANLQLSGAIFVAGVPNYGAVPTVLKLSADQARHGVPTLLWDTGHLVRHRRFAATLMLNSAESTQLLPQLVPESRRAMFSLALPFYPSLREPVPFPLLVVAASQDRLFSVASQEEKARLWDAEFEIVNGAHELMITSPEALATVISDFVADLDGRRVDALP